PLVLVLVGAGRRTGPRGLLVDHRYTRARVLIARALLRVLRAVPGRLLAALAGTRRRTGLVLVVVLARVLFVSVKPHVQPPIGARGLAPQNNCVPSIPMRCTPTRLSTIDFAVAVPTPTGPPLAL